MNVKINIIRINTYQLEFAIEVKIKECQDVFILKMTDKYNVKINLHIKVTKNAMDVKINIMSRRIITYKLKICIGCQDRKKYKDES